MRCVPGYRPGSERACTCPTGGLTCCAPAGRAPAPADAAPRARCAAAGAPMSPCFCRLQGQLHLPPHRPRVLHPLPARPLGVPGWVPARKAHLFIGPPPRPPPPPHHPQHPPTHTHTYTDLTWAAGQPSEAWPLRCPVAALPQFVPPSLHPHPHPPPPPLPPTSRLVLHKGARPGKTRSQHEDMCHTCLGCTASRMCHAQVLACPSCVSSRPSKPLCLVLCLAYHNRRMVSSGPSPGAPSSGRIATKPSCPGERPCKRLAHAVAGCQWGAPRPRGSWDQVSTAGSRLAAQQAAAFTRPWKLRWKGRSPTASPACRCCRDKDLDFFVETRVGWLHCKAG